jgi:hypothetical protein
MSLRKLINTQLNLLYEQDHTRQERYNEFKSEESQNFLKLVAKKIGVGHSDYHKIETILLSKGLLAAQTAWKEIKPLKRVPRQFQDKTKEGIETVTNLVNKYLNHQHTTWVTDEEPETDRSGYVRIGFYVKNIFFRNNDRRTLIKLWFRIQKDGTYSMGLWGVPDYVFKLNPNTFEQFNGDIRQHYWISTPSTIEFFLKSLNKTFDNLFTKVRNIHQGIPGGIKEKVNKLIEYQIKQHFHKYKSLNVAVNWEDVSDLEMKIIYVNESFYIMVDEVTLKFNDNDKNFYYKYDLPVYLRTDNFKNLSPNNIKITSHDYDINQPELIQGIDIISGLNHMFNRIKKKYYKD